MLTVKAADGVKVPMENQPHQYIEQTVVEVEESLYYRRRLADGDLVLVEETQAVASSQKKAKSEVVDDTN